MSIPIPLSVHRFIISFNLFHLVIHQFIWLIHQLVFIIITHWKSNLSLLTPKTRSLLYQNALSRTLLLTAVKAQTKTSILTLTWLHTLRMARTIFWFVNFAFKSLWISTQWFFWGSHMSDLGWHVVWYGPCHDSQFVYHSILSFSMVFLPGIMQIIQSTSPTLLSKERKLMWLCMVSCHAPK